MRPITLVILATICIVIASYRGLRSESSHRPKAASKNITIKVPSAQENTNSQVLYSRWTKPFFGADEETAKQLAVEDGQRELGTWLRSRNVKWSPTSDFVQQLIR